MKPILMLFILSFFLVMPVVARAENIEVGWPLPDVRLSGKAGQLEWAGKKVVYNPWQVQKLRGKIRIIYHVAARWKIHTVNQAFFDAVNSEAFPEEKYNTVSILNIDDVFIGGAAIARYRFEAARKKHPRDDFVLDDRSNIQTAWGLKRRGSAIIIVERDGKVLGYKDGPLTGDEINTFIRLIRKNL